MIGAEVKVQNNVPQFAEAAKKAAFENLRHAAARISKDEKASITKSDEPSEPGEPPHTRGQGGKNLKGAIRFDAPKSSDIADQEAFIGPLASVIGQAGARLEFGDEFEPRPFAEPALEKNLDRLNDDWEIRMDW